MAPTKAFVVSTGAWREAMQRLLPDWKVFAIGDPLLGYCFDEIVVAEDFACHKYRSKVWSDARRDWIEHLPCKLHPGGVMHHLMTPIIWVGL